jgi:carbamoyltransferase
MGLAAYGDPDVYRRQLASIIQVSEDSYQVDLGALGFPSFDPKGFEPLLGPRRKPEAEILPGHMHFAAALQAATNAAVVALLRRLERSVRLKHLCVAGGVALNCVTNELMREASAFSDIFIPSAPHDAGTAIGAALAVHCAESGTRPPTSGATPYLGPQFNERKVLAAIKEAGLTPQRSKNAARDAADMVLTVILSAGFKAVWSLDRARLATGRCLPIPAGPIHERSSTAGSSTGKIFGRSRPASWPSAPTNGSRSGRI